MENPESDWKDEILRDFTRWLSNLPAERAAPPQPGQERRDLAHLYAEFAALRQEIALQSRSHKKALVNLESARSAFDSVGQELKAQRAAVTDALARRDAHFEAQAVIVSFLEIRDSLVRSRAAAARLLEPRGFLQRKPAGADGLVAAFDLIIRKFDRILEEHGIFRIETAGNPFDPATMTAAGTRELPGAPSGTVVEEVRGGFLRNGKVLRAAEVLVNRSGAPLGGESEH